MAKQKNELDGLQTDGILESSVLELHLLLSVHSEVVPRGRY